jgi:hypothetical protein
MSISKKRLLSLAILSLLGLMTIASVSPALADQSLINSQIGVGDIGNVYGGSTPTDIRTLIAQIIVVCLELLASIFIVLTIVAGFQYMTSGGNEEKTGKAVALLRNAIIGLVIVLVSWAVTRTAILVLSRTALNNAVDPWTGI